MSLRPASNIALAPLAAPPGETPRSRILSDGVPAGEVSGAVLEAALATGDGYLLFVTDDVPFEDSLRIKLFDPGWARRDGATLAWPYATGSFRDLNIVAPDRLRFAFFDEPVELQLLAAPERRLWPGGDPRGVHRRFGAPRWFRLMAAG